MLVEVKEERTFAISMTLGKLTEHVSRWNTLFTKLVGKSTFMEIWVYVARESFAIKGDVEILRNVRMPASRQGFITQVFRHV